MKKVTLKKLKISNFGPILEDEVDFESFTYFIGRNNAGKSHYVKAIEVLLSNKSPTEADLIKLQKDKQKEIRIEADFEGVQDFTGLVKKSNHKEAIDGAIKDGILKVVRIFNPGNEEEPQKFGVQTQDGEIYNPSGFTSNLLAILPEPISIVANADTAEELKSKENTALGKLKKEVMITFLGKLKEKTQSSLEDLNEFLHSQIQERRSPELQALEANLKQELVGEFSDVIPSIKFNLPDEEVIAKEMKIILDDGYPSEVEQKGHGLQRAVLLALLRLLAKHGVRYQNKPAPIFLIGELESFLHPFAQKQLAKALTDLEGRYQIVTTTHSPFIISPEVIKGYRKVRKDIIQGTKARKPAEDLNFDVIKRMLERRGNLEGLFADSVILIEGQEDEECFQKLLKIFNLDWPKNKFTIFVKVDGKENLRIVRNFYLNMGFDRVTVLSDLDYAFCNDFKNLLKELEMEADLCQKFREHIGYTDTKSPSLDTLMNLLKEKGSPDSFKDTMNTLKLKNIFILEHGAPEMYYKNDYGKKDGWKQLTSDSDLLEKEYLKELMTAIIAL